MKAQIPAAVIITSVSAFAFCYQFLFCHCNISWFFNVLFPFFFFFNISIAYFLCPVYCVTSPKKDDRYREPPPTPPGYMGISLADIKEGSPHHPHLKPPDYSVAVQRSKMLHSDLSRLPAAALGSDPVACVSSRMPPWHGRQPSSPRVADMPGADSEEDGRWTPGWGAGLCRVHFTAMFWSFSGVTLGD